MVSWAPPSPGLAPSTRIGNVQLLETVLRPLRVIHGAGSAGSSLPVPAYKRAAGTHAGTTRSVACGSAVWLRFHIRVPNKDRQGSKLLHVPVLHLGTT